MHEHSSCGSDTCKQVVEKKWKKIEFRIRPIPYVPLPIDIEILPPKYFVNPIFLLYRLTEKARQKIFFVRKKLNSQTDKQTK